MCFMVWRKTEIVIALVFREWNRIMKTEKLLEMTANDDFDANSDNLYDDSDDIDDNDDKKGDGWASASREWHNLGCWPVANQPFFRVAKNNIEKYKYSLKIYFKNTS